MAKKETFLSCCEIRQKPSFLPTLLLSLSLSLTFCVLCLSFLGFIGFFSVENWRSSSTDSFAGVIQPAMILVMIIYEFRSVTSSPLLPPGEQAKHVQDRLNDPKPILIDTHKDNN